MGWRVGERKEGERTHGGAAEEDIIMGRAWPRASEVAEDERGKEKFVKGNGARERNGANERTNERTLLRLGGERGEDGSTCFDLVLRSPPSASCWLA